MDTQGPIEQPKTTPVGVGCIALVGAAWKPPFRYEQDGTMIVDSQDTLALDVRGWGYLTGAGGMDLDHDKAAGIQDALGSLVADLLNRELLKAPTAAGERLPAKNI